MFLPRVRTKWNLCKFYLHFKAVFQCLSDVVLISVYYLHLYELLVMTNSIRILSTEMGLDFFLLNIMLNGKK